MGKGRFRWSSRSCPGLLGDHWEGQSSQWKSRQVSESLSLDILIQMTGALALFPSWFSLSSCLQANSQHRGSPLNSDWCIVPCEGAAGNCSCPHRATRGSVGNYSYCGEGGGAGPSVRCGTGGVNLSTDHCNYGWNWSRGFPRNRHHRREQVVMLLHLGPFVSRI